MGALVPVTPTVAQVVQDGRRPAYVMVGEVRVSILAHDTYHRIERKKWRQRLAMVHPDRLMHRRYAIAARTHGPHSVKAYTYRRHGKTIRVPGYAHPGATIPPITARLGRMAGSKLFRKTSAAFDRWLKTEARWYALYNLGLP